MRTDKRGQWFCKDCLRIHAAKGPHVAVEFSQTMGGRCRFHANRRIDELDAEIKRMRDNRNK